MGVQVYKCFSPSKDTILSPLSKLHAKGQKSASLAFRDFDKRGGGVADDPPDKHPRTLFWTTSSHAWTTSSCYKLLPG